jgi:hypothetical protein
VSRNGFFYSLELTICALVLSGVFTQGAWATSSGDSASGEVSSSDGSGGDTKAFKDLSLMGLWMTQSGLQSASDPNYQAETDFNLIANYKISSDYSLTGNFGFRKELTQDQRLLGQDGLVSIQHKAIALNPYIKFTPAIGARIPISEQSSDYDSMYGGVQASGRIDFNGKAIGVSRASFTYVATVGRDFYKYNQAVSGGAIANPNGPAQVDGSGNPIPSSGSTSSDQINIAYDFKNVALFNYQLTDALSFTETGIYVAGMDFDNNVRGNFELTEELDYQFAKNFTVGVGLSNGGNLLGPDGQSSNVEIYNPNASSVYCSVILTY